MQINPLHLRYALLSPKKKKSMLEKMYFTLIFTSVNDDAKDNFFLLEIYEFLSIFARISPIDFKTFPVSVY